MGLPTQTNNLNLILNSKTMKESSWFRAPAYLSLTILAGLLPGCTTYVESPGPATVYAPPPMVQPAPVYAAPPPQPPVEYIAPAPEVVEIHAESDFYEPLQPYGRWIDVLGYGRCWAPARVDPDWRPYTDGHWQRTDAGWYWVSDEPWGWATCHYGRWHRDDISGWVWIPQTQWAPAWVAWREGGGYTGWAPLPPEARFGPGGTLEIRNEDLEPRSFVFVDQRRMLEPQRHQTVIVNNTTIINRTVNITKIVVVNKTIINEGPRPEAVAQATGRQVEVVPAHTLRTRQEAPTVAAHLLHTPGSVNHVPPNVPPTHNHADTPVTRAPVVRPNEPVVANPAASLPVVAKPHAPTVYNEGRPPVTNHVFRPTPKPTVSGQPPAQTSPSQPAGSVPRQFAPESIRPGPNSRTDAVAGNGQVPAKPAHPALTPQQKLELERKQKEAEKRRLERANPHSQPSTNSVPPH